MEFYEVKTMEEALTYQAQKIARNYCQNIISREIKNAMEPIMKELMDAIKVEVVKSAPNNLTVSLTFNDGKTDETA